VPDVRAVLQGYVERGSIPGAVALLARGDEVQVHAVGSMQTGPDRSPMESDTIFRIASITKPITAAGAMVLVDDGRIALDDSVAGWLPELDAPVVVRTPASPIDDVVPARRGITVRDLLTSRPGWGFPADFGLPAIQALFSVQKDGRAPHLYLPPDEWLAALAKIPMVAQPGEAWLYDTAMCILGVLIARVAGKPLHEFLAERLFEPLGMTDSGFAIPAAKLDRFASYYVPDETGALQPGDSQQTWTNLPAFESGSGGVLGTAGDWLRFARMLLADGVVDGRQVLSRESTRQMLTNHIPSEQRESARFFLEGQGWGFGGSVDVAPAEPWQVPGRYGWVGGTGTAAHLIPSTGAVAILLTQVGVTSPEPTPQLLDFLRAAA
jgi:CubicO group peptidase (beta-lactamase class C family)